MIDNFKAIRPLLKFESEDDFYYLQLLQRKKEVDTLDSNSNVVKSYYVGNLEYFDKKEKEIKELCDYFHARAMLRLNRRSWEQCALQGLGKIAGQCASKDYRSVRKFYERVCGRYTSEPKSERKWIVDIDGASRANNAILQTIDNCDPIGNKLVKILPSKSGLHIITNPFNVAQFKQEFPEIDIHKDNPTNLYIP